MYKELVIHFILGGYFYFQLFIIFANIVEDPSLSSAIIALLPIAIFSGFIIDKVDTCKKNTTKIQFQH